MRIATVLGLGMVVSLTACSHLNTGMKNALEPDTACAVTRTDGAFISPYLAAALVYTNPDHCQTGTFAMTVRSTSRAGSVLYLNSSQNFFDPFNLAIAVLPRAQKELETSLDGAAGSDLVGRTIVVEGTARRVKTVVESRQYAALPGDANGGWVAPYGIGSVSAVGQWHLSHVLVTSADQISLRTDTTR